MILEIFLMVIGIGLLIKGADFLVDGSSLLAEKFGVSKLVVGLTIVAFGTSLPELFINIFASINHQSEIVLGNIIGSNISNIALILALTTIIIGSIKIKQSTIWREIPYSIFATLLLMILSIKCISSDNIISLTDGIILLLFLGLFLYYVFNLIKNFKANSKVINTEKKNNDSNFKLSLMILGGLIALFIGSKWTVNGTVIIAQYFGISEFVISATIIAIGTSLPELVTTVTATRKGSFDMAVGNLVGSNIFNILFIIGVSAIISNVIVPTYIIIDMIFLLFVTSLMFIFMFTGKKHHIDRTEGIILLALYVLYIFFILNR